MPSRGGRKSFASTYTAVVPRGPSPFPGSLRPYGAAPGSSISAAPADDSSAGPTVTAPPASASTSGEAGELPPGTPVGEYVIERRLGAGGMGEVYGAIHPLIHKRVAIKVLRRHLCGSPVIVQRFIAEARAVNRIG